MRSVLVAAVLVAVSSGAGAAPASATTAEIEHLFAYLQASGCQFGRNGDWHAPQEAVQHLRTKFEYLVEKDMVTTTESFIARAASQSSMSGKPYWVQCGNAAPLTSAGWFQAELLRLRKARPPAR